MESSSRFQARKAIDRLRDGLSDAVAIDRLTMEEQAVKKQFSDGLHALDSGASRHLCICGSYGQGKSHRLAHLQQIAVSQGYATSLVQLDLREIPFHQFSVVYHAIMTKLFLLKEERFVVAWKKWGRTHSLEILRSMPYRFQLILSALLHSPKATSHLLESALMGHELPLMPLKKSLNDVLGSPLPLDVHASEQSNAQDKKLARAPKRSLMCRGNLPYLQMLQTLGDLLRAMGYKGLVLFFDEAESIAQGRLGQRAKSYEILNQLFSLEHASGHFIYPIFAFTADFFEKVNHEQYDEKPQFSQNYAEAWKQLSVVHLNDFSEEGWRSLQHRLIQLYAEAYQFDLTIQAIELQKKLQALLEKLQSQETRFKLKALVNQLDIETQHLCTLS